MKKKKQRKQRTFSKATKDMTGQTFGMLTVIERAPIKRNTKNRDALWVVQCECGNKIIVSGSSMRTGHTKSCGCLIKINWHELTYGKGADEHYKWSGGRSIDKNGYVWLSKGGVAKLYPNAVIPDTHGGMFEHRAVMSHYLGRMLYPGETVHHKNGHHADNRIENLELHASAHGQGSTPEELIDWAITILNRYAPQHLKK